MNTHQRRTFKLIRLEEALRLIEQAVPNQPLGYETVKTINSLRRVLAEDIVSEVYLPDHDFAAMDGYAVKTQNIQGAEKNSVKLTITGELYPPDHPTDASIGDDETMYVACGAPIPKGADAVLKVENVLREDGEITVKNLLESNRNICQTGEDVKKQELVLPKGRTIRPQDIGLLVALNREYVKVVRRPRVAVISVGDELTEPFQNAPNKIVNNNAYIVSSLVEYFNAEPILMGIAEDSLEDISRKITSAIEKADIAITIAGCSVGLKDYVPDVIENLGEPGIIFHGVALSAGKVSGFGVVRGKPVIMLPGHVGSTIGAFYLMVVPLLNMWLGLGFNDRLPVVKCVLDGPVKAKPAIELVLPVRVYRRGGEYHAVPLRKPLSVLKNLADANGYALIPAGSVLDEGAAVDVRIFGGLEFYNLEG
ncbi:MAG: molybdopterin molybdotransferase MoeA [Nitrososphaerales archaeon]